MGLASRGIFAVVYVREMTSYQRTGFYLLAKEKEGWRVINQVAASRLETLRETDGRKDSDQ
ncbi:MAG: hypothetical protein EHM18_04825 [Acidobacteria bacterium]|nr:MAG: hypothetical protein EHM18_04825 [Acidobacteriota bacterium]